MIRRYVVFLISLFCFAQVMAQEIERQPAASGLINKITVKGQRKIEGPAIKNKLNTKLGSVFSKNSIKKDIKNLFETGFFYDVSVSRKGSELIYTVEEKPTITKVNYIGNSEIDDDEMAETTGLKAYEFVDHTKLSEAVEKIQKLYEEKGYFLARITYKQKKNKDGVEIDVSIKENDKVRVKRIRILGNKHFPDNKVKSIMRTKEGGLFGFMSSDDSYKQDMFDQDVGMLQFLYFNEGYVQAKIDRPQVYVTPDKKSIYITIRVEEGDQFTVGNIGFSGDLMFEESTMMEKISLKEGDVFSSQNLRQDISALQAMYGDKGYAFANPIPRTQIIAQDKKINILYEIEKGEKVYIGNINVIGNTRTRDKVVRRELKIAEGELYNESRRRESEGSVRRLGFFDEVTFSTSSPDQREDVMNIDIIVKERNTGQLQVGAGYSSQQGFIFTGSVNQMNFLGKGQKLGASLNYNEKQSDFTVSFTDPYFRDTDWSLGYDLYHTRQVTTEYEQTKTGGAVRVGHPLGEYWRGFIRYKIDDTDINLLDGDAALFPVETANGITSSVTLTALYDKRNDRFAPSEGIYTNLSVEYAGLGGDKNYTKGLANFRYYKKIFWDVVWRNNINYGVIGSNDSKAAPFNELFLLGGANTLRGYQYFTIGKREFSATARAAAISAGLSNAEADIIAMRPYGGTQQFYYNLEFMFPLLREAKIHGVVFYDIGEAQDTIDLGNLKSDVGFGFRWFSPIGPLRFEYGFPINPDEKFHQNRMYFNFAIGTPF